MINTNRVDILLVEDNSSDADLTLRALKKKDLDKNIFLCEDGVEALDYIFSRGSFKDRKAERYPRLIIMDLKMPRIDGIEILKQIKANEETKVIPVLVLTSSNQYSDVIRCYRAGANAYVVKPLDFQEYMETVSEAAYFWLNINYLP